METLQKIGAAAILPLEWAMIHHPKAVAYSWYALLLAFSVAVVI